MTIETAVDHGFNSINKCVVYLIGVVIICVAFRIIKDKLSSSY